MMTIKVQRKDEHGMTYLHEVKNPQYRYEYYKNYNDYCDLFKRQSEDYLLVTHVDMRDLPADTGEGQLLSIHYSLEDNTLGVIFTQNAVVYVMSDGKTIDTIYC